MAMSASGWCARREFDTDDAARARTVIDNKRLLHAFTQLLRDRTQNKIRITAGRCRHDHANGFDGIILRSGLEAEEGTTQ